VRPRDAEDAADWLRLARSENIGPVTFFALLGRFGSAGEALAALPELAARRGRRRIRIADRADVERELRAAKKAGARPVFFGTSAYPPRLAAIHGPPPVVMVRGDAAQFARPAIAVVGSRNASAAGRTMARRLAEGFGAAGRVVVSGLALGIDAEAHSASLATGTIAVLAGGVDRPTPEENLALAGEIAGRGALVSEMPMGMGPFARHYVRRNRLIAGLSEAVVVVEAATRSGALHTARFALEEGREVFAVPGSPLDPRAAGCLRLLRDGAGLAAEPEDVLAVLRDEPVPAPGGLAEPAAEPPPEPPSDAVEAVAAALSMTPMPVDALVRDTGLPAATVTGALVELELAGRAIVQGTRASLLAPPG
jgi:DNA processing protein